MKTAILIEEAVQRIACSVPDLRAGVLSVIVSLACVAAPRAAELPERHGAGELARQIVRASGVTGGVIVHLGCGDGSLTAALRANERYVVRGLDGNPANVETARRTIDARGAYGPVSVECCGDGALPFADNLVNLLVVSKGEAGGAPTGTARRVVGWSWPEMLRVLAPGGVALIAKATGEPLEAEGAVARRVVIDGGQWSMLRKPWPSNIDQWTHWLHGADGNPVARDTVVGPPRRMQWWASPTWSRSHEKSPSLTGMVSAGGRVFYICDEGPADIGGPLPDRWRLVTRDAFNGVLLWKLPVADWGWQAWSPGQPMNLRWGNPRFIHRRLVADGQRVYVTLGYSAPVSALDAATGEVIRIYPGTEDTCEILCNQGRLVLSVATEPKTATNKAPPLKIMVLDAARGTLLWQTGPLASLYDLGERGKENVLKQGHLMIAADDGNVFCVTSEDILAFHLADGKLAWRTPRPSTVQSNSEKAVLVEKKKRLTNLGSLMVHDGRVFYAQPHPSEKKLVNNVPMTLVCLAASTGTELWRLTCGDWSYTTSLNVYAARGLIWVHADPKQDKYDLLGLDPETGQIRVRHNLASVLTTRHHHRCYRNKATENFLLMSKEGVEYVDLASGAAVPNRWIRGMCLYGVMPANGLLYVPPHACSCNPMTMLQGYWALAPAAAPTTASALPPAKRLERGSAYSSIPDLQPPTPESGDWPMYRHDPLRSGAATCSVSTNLAPCWRTELGGKLTAPVVADGRVYVGRRDAHEIVALEAGRGAVLWGYRTGSPIDTPPTFHKGMLLAGCSDGWVYCLRAADGRLRWRFRAAPLPRAVVADGRLESAWPVHGSVMVYDNVAYVAAGRSSYLDGGMRFYMLDPASGEVIREMTFSTEQSDQETFSDGVVSDLLVSSGDALFMRHLRVHPDTLEVSRVGSWTFNGPQGGKVAVGTSGTLPVSEGRSVYLRSGQGLLDDSLYGRTQFHLDGGEFCHLLCFDRSSSYGFQMSTHTGHFVFFTPGKEGYTILAFDRSRSKGKVRTIWQQKLPLRVYGMLLAGKKLLLGGVPDVVDPDDPLSSFEGRMGGRLLVLESQTGKSLSELKLDAPPVFDSLAAAAGGLYLADWEGVVSCFQ